MKYYLKYVENPRLYFFLPLQLLIISRMQIIVNVSAFYKKISESKNYLNKENGFTAHHTLHVQVIIIR